MMWGRKSRPSSNPLYQRLCNPIKAGDIQSFLYHINSHCTINSLRRILRPFDHILLNGVVLPSYIQLGNEAVHELTVGNARNTVLYYLSDVHRGGSRGMAPEPTMGRDLEALLCMLLGITTLQGIDSGRMGRDFIVEVIKTKNAIDPLLFTALGSNLPTTACPRISGARIHNTTTEKNPVSYKHPETPTAGYVFNANPLKAINVSTTSKAAIAHTNHIQQATGLAPQNRLAMTGSASFSKTNYLQASGSGLKPTTSDSSSQQTALPNLPSETERHVSDLLLKTIDLGIKQSLIETQEKQLSACKDSIKQLADVCASLLQNSKTSGVVNGILQEVMDKLVSAGVVCSDIPVMGNGDQSHTPSIPGPIRRTVRSTLQSQSRTRGDHETCAGSGTTALVATRHKKSTETSRVTPYPAVLAGTIDARNLLLAKIQQKVRTRQKNIRKGKNVVGNQQAINNLEKTIRSLQTMTVLTPQQAANVTREIQEMELVKEVSDGREVEVAEHVNVKKKAQKNRDSGFGVSQVATTVNGMVATENNGDHEDKGRSSNPQVNLKGSQFAFNLPIPGIGMIGESLPPSVVMQTYPPLLPLSPPPPILNSRGTEINNPIFTSALSSFMKDYGHPCSKTMQLGWSKDCPILIDDEGEQSQN